MTNLTSLSTIRAFCGLGGQGQCRAGFHGELQAEVITPCDPTRGINQNSFKIFAMGLWEYQLCGPGLAQIHDPCLTGRASLHR